MEEYKVFIPCAGLGTRLGIKYNKALVTVSDKPVIAHIIDSISSDITIVIALGYDGSNVKEVIELLYPDRNIEFVEIDPYEGKGSGLGTTLLQSKDYLQCPFIFWPCDTLIKEQVPLPDKNWMGYTRHTPTKQYRTININRNGYVTEICSKNAIGQHLYIGLAGIYDYKIFWKAMEEGVEFGSIESGECYGLKYLLQSPIEAKKFIWFDTGTPYALTETRKSKLWTTSGANILPKDNEAIWFTNIGGSQQKYVVKFSIDQQFIKNRIERAEYLQGYIPDIIYHGYNLYSYYMQDGDTLSNRLTTQNFAKLLDCLKDFWQPTCCIFTNKDYPTDFEERCLYFYKDKTYKRVKEYFKTFEQIDQPEIINGSQVPSIFEILDKIDWQWIANGVPSNRFHGDLHFENILIDENDKFTFLDWRQDFGGLLTYGDVYYDLAKLYHGVLISHELIVKNLFSHQISNNIITFDYLRKHISVDIENMFQKFVLKQGYDYRKVQMMTYLIFINIAALHHYPYGLFLFHLGKLGIWSRLNDTTY